MGNQADSLEPAAMKLGSRLAHRQKGLVVDQVVWSQAT